ncbi:cytochrome o ubiquinol oxidase operon protein cyoD [Bosea sp. OAE752]|jgi:cytochrome o ubiquinol oxidase operon protein cyoD|uniref:Cytochrome bo(3) ubiquinol oxidase subunit 4 n=1 Tax=Bosea spartocytisi TaxID=2773451 RepID=A0A927E8X7_9HYPH|nr:MULTISPECIES: cytochrome o ubiquinol oxidase subunit IV [Bosea]MBD3846459.1 cytochrome o ubiquinol oxidase subunit IV [Bosea spartocytisi]MCT4472005.1 cytochrome o ubiquinol oxidase subunit IV [Bosea spartocytisi]
MSGSQDHSGAHAEAHGAGHDDHGASHATLRGYLTGFVLAAILTAIPFWLVMGDVLGNSTVTALVVMAFAAVQIVVHMVYFLHMNSRSEGGWTMMALIFTIVIVVIALSGSLWVMYHLNSNMMPMAPGDHPM